MARIYVGQFDNVVVSAAQDLFAIIPTTTPKAIRLLRCVISAADTTIPTSQMVRVKVNLMTGTLVTAGSGGTTPAIQRVDPGDPAPTGFTLAANNTTQSTTTGTNYTVYDGGFHIYNGFDESFFADGSNPRGAMPMFVQNSVTVTTSAQIVVSTASTVSGTVHLNGTIWVEEAG